MIARIWTGFGITKNIGNPKARRRVPRYSVGFGITKNIGNPKGDCGQTAAEAFWDYGKYRKTKGKIFMQKLDCGSERTFFERKGELEDNIWR